MKFLLTTLLLVAFSQTAGAAPENIRVIFHSNLNGQITDCGWASYRLGGLSRQASLLEKLTSNHSSIIVGSGNIFCDSEERADSSSVFRGARKIAKSYQRMGYSAVNVGHHDLTAHQQAVAGKVEQDIFVSLDLRDNTGKFLFTPYKVVQIGTKKIAITGLTGKAATPYTTTPWQQALKENLSQINTESDFIILLSSLSTADNRRIAQNFPDIQVIINSDPHINNLSPSMINKTLLTQTKPLGQYLGVLDLSFGQSNKWKENYYRINSLKVKEQVIRQQLKKEKDNQTQLQAQLTAITPKLAQRTEELATQPGIGFTVKFIPVEALLNKHPSIEAIVNK